MVIYEQAGGLKGLTGDNVLLVVEIAGSSLRYDVGRKAGLYATLGVRELWVIDAIRLTTRLFRKPSAEGYGEVEEVSAGSTAMPRFAPAVFALDLQALDMQ